MGNYCCAHDPDTMIVRTPRQETQISEVSFQPEIKSTQERRTFTNPDNKIVNNRSPEDEQYYSVRLVDSRMTAPARGELNKQKPTVPKIENFDKISSKSYFNKKNEGEAQNSISQDSMLNGDITHSDSRNGNSSTIDKERKIAGDRKGGRLSGAPAPAYEIEREHYKRESNAYVELESLQMMKPDEKPQFSTNTSEAVLTTEASSVDQEKKDSVSSRDYQKEKAFKERIQKFQGSSQRKQIIPEDRRINTASFQNLVKRLEKHFLNQTVSREIRATIILNEMELVHKESDSVREKQKELKEKFTKKLKPKSPAKKDDKKKPIPDDRKLDQAHFQDLVRGLERHVLNEDFEEIQEAKRQERLFSSIDEHVELYNEYSSVLMEKPMKRNKTVIKKSKKVDF